MTSLMTANEDSTDLSWEFLDDEYCHHVVAPFHIVEKETSLCSGIDSLVFLVGICVAHCDN